MEIADDALPNGVVFTAETEENVTLTYAITDVATKACRLFASPSDISGTITIPATPEGYTMTTIGRGTFSGRRISSVVIPATVKAIEPYAFASCRELTAVTSLIAEPFAIDSLVFSIYDSESKEYYFTDATLHVPAGTKALYETTPGWSNFTKIVEMGDNAIVHTVKSAESQVAPVHTLSGQRLSHPRKGVNIVDGRKVVVR